jgi:TRAP-type uncharacterized transport system substrate-binding protein
MTTFDIQAGGTNPHYGRITHWLAGNLVRRFPDATVNIKVGKSFQDVSAVGDGLAQIGIATPAMAARLCYDGNATFDRPRPALRSIGVVPHRDALVLGVGREFGLTSFDELRERRVPLRLSVPTEQQMTGHASRHVLAVHGITREELESWGGTWIDTESAQTAWKMVATGEADAMINESIPQSFRPLSKARPLSLLTMRQSAVEELEAEMGYRWRTVDAGTVYGQDEPIIGLSWEHWIVVAHADLPDEAAYCLADAFFSDARHLERQYTADNRLSAEDCSLEYPMRPEVVANEVTIPLHPGAEARYREAGVLRDRT